RAVADLVPGAIRRRVKRGLTVPLAAWLAGPLLPFARETLARLDPRVIQPDAVASLLAAHVAGRRDNRRELWALVMPQPWGDAGRGRRRPCREAEATDPDQRLGRRVLRRARRRGARRDRRAGRGVPRRGVPAMGGRSLARRGRRDPGRAVAARNGARRRRRR